MSEFLRDPVWQFIGVALTLMFIGITILLWRMQRQRKRLSYEIISQTPLLRKEKEIKGKLEILFSGLPVEDVYLVEAKIINSGNVPIVSTDYEQPLCLQFSEKTHILTADVSKTYPESLEVSVNIQNTKIVLSPVLLNSGDSVTLQMLINQFDGKITFGGRVIGVRELRKWLEERPEYGVLSLIVVPSLIALWILVLRRLSETQSTSDIIFSILMLIVMSALPLIAFSKDLQKWVRRFYD
jgi:hypothetical protein